MQRLRARHTITVVAVAGSMGKTSAKASIAQLLGVSKRVAWQQGNYNDRLTIPLIFFGHANPSLFNLPAWVKIIFANERTIRGEYPYDVAVVELGTDAPGQIAKFAYLKPDLTVLTAVSPEHMATFKTLDAVAAEETLVFGFSAKVLVNADDVPPKYLRGHEAFASYGFAHQAEYRAQTLASSPKGQHLRLYLHTEKVEAATSFLGTQGAKVVLAAVAAASLLGVTSEEITRGVPKLKPFSGRMQLLPGVSNATLIDDTYNAAPLTVKAALDVLYALPAPQRIAVLGSMNELGGYTPAAHREVGEYCDPHKLDLVITVGTAAEKDLAPAAKARGCNVQSFASPYDAAELLTRVLKQGAVVLFKGSQNGVFTEEALKPLLASADDAAKLVRQSPAWMAIKRKQFGPPLKPRG